MVTHRVGLSLSPQGTCLLFDRVAATIYHLFLAEDNSPELFAQAKRIHSMLPYSALKQVIRFANPAAVMSGVLDLFLAQPFGARSLAQRVLALALNDGIRSFQRSIDSLVAKISDPVLCEKLKRFCNADEDTKNIIRKEAADDDVELIISILRTELIAPELTPEQIGKVFNAYVAWNNAVENVCDKVSPDTNSLTFLGRRRDEARRSVLRLPEAAP